MSPRLSPDTNGEFMANVTAQDDYDPFPQEGPIKQYERLIRKIVGIYRGRYPNLSYQELLIEAVRLAFRALKRFDSQKGKFGTLLIQKRKSDCSIRSRFSAAGSAVGNNEMPPLRTDARQLSGSVCRFSAALIFAVVFHVCCTEPPTEFVTGWKITRTDCNTCNTLSR